MSVAGNRQSDPARPAQVRDLIKATSAKFTGKPRGADRKVRRHS
jgi:hypothetical protein